MVYISWEITNICRHLKNALAYALSAWPMYKAMDPGGSECFTHIIKNCNDAKTLHSMLLFQPKTTKLRNKDRTKICKPIWATPGQQLQTPLSFMFCKSLFCNYNTNPQ